MSNNVNEVTQLNTETAYWRTQEMLLLQQVTSLASKQLNTQIVFREILHLMSELLGLNRGRIILLEDNKKFGSIKYAYGLTRQEVERGRYALGEGITGSVLEMGQTIIVQNIDEDHNFLARSVKRENLPQEIVSFYALPIQVDSKTVGVLACHRIRLRRRMMNDDLTILKILTTMISQILYMYQHIEDKTSALALQNDWLKKMFHSDSTRYGIVGKSPQVLKAITTIEQVSQANASVLLLGESGTGKELFARALHLASPRREEPFIKVNCAAIPENLFESELFGHEKGAFTGAVGMRAGFFEQANGGTIFLDEIGEMPMPMQTKLLRTLQEGTLTRLGGKSEIKISVRVVAATNRDLAHEVNIGNFRQDLFYRLNVIPIQLPSLAERRSDIPLLAMYFLNKTNQNNQKNLHLNQSALDQLQQHTWPGNIRELSNFIERLVLLSDKSIVSSEDIQFFLTQNKAENIHLSSRRHHLAPIASAAFHMPYPAEMPNNFSIRPYAKADSHEINELMTALERAGGNKTRAAQLLGMTPRQFSYRLGKMNEQSN